MKSITAFVLISMGGLVLLAQRPAADPLTYERLRNAQAEPQNWLMYWGNYQGTHYSSLKQLDKSNVNRLQDSWTVQMTGMRNLQATPLVVDGVMYVSGAPGTVYALDAKTGKEIWKYERPQKVRNPNESNPFNRGVAVMGNHVFAGTLDAALIALDRTNGSLLWETQVADTMVGYSITQSPLVLKDKIIVGVAGGEFGIRGFIDAYDLDSGKRLWRFYAIPGPGEFGNNTWKGDSWMHGGGSTWLTGTYDADLDVLYWPIGNPSPDIDGSVRLGDNLFSCSIVALDPNTGQRKWHYQFTPGDTHDWDSTEDMVLVDRAYNGQQRKLLLHADRNGMFYVLDRTTGKFLSATAFVKQTWNSGFDANGRPIVIEGSKASPDGSIPVFPSLSGGTNFQAPSYDPATGWLILEYQEAGQRYFVTPEEYKPGSQYQGGRQTRVADEPTTAGIRALNPETGKVEWETRIARGSLNNGLLATGGGIVFASVADGTMLVLDSKTGALLRTIKLSNAMASSPMSYSVDGKQFIGVMAGTVLHSLALPD
ncbi:MAG TPA: PQQ-dependent dehydrogenase, methanol/ethanol family [Terriglobia bacterium]|nr:PQQ-dependent dehydrogenase, methanol/ethanol family [Terriglobia bacterium]